MHRERRLSIPVVTAYVEKERIKTRHVKTPWDEIINADPSTARWNFEHTYDEYRKYTKDIPNGSDVVVITAPLAIGEEDISPCRDQGGGEPRDPCAFTCAGAAGDQRVRCAGDALAEDFTLACPAENPAEHAMRGHRSCPGLGLGRRRGDVGELTRAGYESRHTADLAG